jgi:ParB-like nuclease family protein
MSPTSSHPIAFEFVPVNRLRHIENFSRARVAWLVEKIRSEGIWTRPLALDERYDLVLDGQHRMEAAKILQLKRVPAIRYNYAKIEVWSLRPKHQFDWKVVTERAKRGEIYPYKTVKHRFPSPLPEILVFLKELR